MFEKNLTELVKGIRANKDSEGEYIAKALGEIKKELQQSDGAVKAVAVQKLVFLNMLGYTLEPYAFHIVEVMSQPWYGHRRVAYLAASQSFTSKTDVILLTTHLFRKAFSSSGGSPYEAAAALNCLSNVVTKDLAMDLLSDVFGMLNSSRVYLRKKAVLVLLRIFQAWPKALRLSFDRLKEKLTDDDPGVVSAAVYVLCELAAANPKNYVPLAPLFFKIMTNSQNNWVMIKVVKLMGLLVPLEPRLAKKLANPLSDIIESTPAKSLVYECINTLLSGKITSKAVIRLCLDKLREFIENYDQNLKYLGLLGLNKLMRQHPRAVAEHTELILECLADDDTTIRMRALDLISGMVSKRNIKGITRRLLEHAELSDGSYREHVLARVLSIGSHDNYCYIADFEWYVSTLVDVTQFHGASRDNADTVAAQLIDLAIRVEGVRPFVVACMVDLIHDTRLHDAQDAMSCVLIAAAHIVGEFSRYVEDHAELVRSMLSGSIATLDHKTQTVFIQNFIKVFAAGASLTLPAAADADDAADDAPAPTPAPTVPRAASMTDWRARVHQMAEIVKTRLPLFSQSNHIEVQERACAYLPVIEWIDEQVASPSWDEIGGAVPDEQQSQQAAAERLDPRAVTDQLRALFAGMLTPVKASAQKKVPVPRGLDLDAWINEPEQSSDEDAGSELDDEHFWSDASSQQSWRAKSKQMSPEALERAAKERARRRRAREQDPYYINDSARPARNAHHGSEDDFLDDDSIGGDLNVRDIPISQAPEDLPPLTVESTSSRRTRNQHRGRISRGRGFSEEDIHESSGSRYTVKSFDDGAAAENEARARGSDSEEGGLGEVDLTKPLGDDEVIPHVLTYAERERAANKKNRDGKKKKKKKGESSKKKKKKRDKGGDSAAAQPEMARTESFDPLAAPEPKKSKKHKKHSKRNGAEQLLDVRPAVCQQTLFHNDALTVTASVFSVEDGKKARKSKSKSKKGAKPAALACARITFTAHVPISGVSVALSSASKHVKVVRAEPRAEAMGALAAGEVAVQSHILKLHKMAAPVQLQAALSVSGGAPSMLDTPLVVPLSVIVLPVKMSAEQITDLMTGDECAALAATKLKLNSLSVGEALKLVPSVLNVALIRAANYTAMFHGQTARGRHVVVLVKANKDEAKQANAGISVQVKSGSEGISQQLLDELHAALTA